MFVAGEWGSVCDDGWDAQDATVVCRQLGFDHDNAQAFPAAHFGEGSGQIWLDEVACTGSELTLDACGHNGWGTHNCDHSEDAGVSCTNCRYYCKFRFMYIKHCNVIMGGQTRHVYVYIKN